MSRPLIIAHRGASLHAPENTLAALRMAIDAGADGVEFDVQVSNDGVPVVFHDLDLRRIAGRSRRVRDLTVAELKDVDVGAWYDRKRRRRRSSEFAGEKIPTLEEVLRLLDGFTGRIYVELKAAPSGAHEMVSTVCGTLGDSRLLPQMIVKSFRSEILPEVRRVLPDVTTAALFAPEIVNLLKSKESLVAHARSRGADELSLHRTLATKRTCSLATAAGMPITVWTADDVSWIDKCRTRGIAALITNGPAKMLAAR